MTDFENLLKGVFAPPPKGTERTMIFNGLVWNMSSGFPESVRVSEDWENWRLPTEREISDARKAFNL